MRFSNTGSVPVSTCWLASVYWTNRKLLWYLLKNSDYEYLNCQNSFSHWRFSNQKEIQVKHSASRCVAIDGSVSCSTCAAFPSLLGEKAHPSTSSKMFWCFSLNSYIYHVQNWQYQAVCGSTDKKNERGGLDFQGLIECKSHVWLTCKILMRYQLL